MKAEKPEAENLSPKAGVWVFVVELDDHRRRKVERMAVLGILFSQNLNSTAIIHCDTYSLEGL